MILINIGNKARPFKFGFNAIDIFCREHKIGIAEFGERFAQIGKGNASIGELRDIIYAGLAGGALSSNEAVSFTCYQVGDWMDELPQGELAKMMEAITTSVNVTGSASGKKRTSLEGKGDRQETINPEVNWDSLLAQSSRAGLAYSDFWKMTPNEWSAWMQGYMLHEEDEWRRLRVIYALIYNTHVERHHQMKPEELIPLQSDKVDEAIEETTSVRHLTDEERRRIKEMYQIK